MNNKFKYIFKTASNLLLAVLFFSTSCKSNSSEDLKQVEDTSHLPSLELVDFESTMLDSGRVKHRIITPQLLKFDNAKKPYTEYPKGGQVMTFDKTGKVVTQIKCEYAHHTDEDKLWDLQNNVEAINEDGVVFNTEQLYWDQKAKEMYTEKFVKITTDDEIITGYGLTATEDMKRYRIKNVSGILGIDE